MRFFTLLLDPDDRGISERVRRSYEAMPRRRGLDFAWQSFKSATVLSAWDDPYGEPLVIKHGDYLAVGMVRLDNRADLERWTEGTGEKSLDLGLVLRVVARHGTRYISRILGDFAFVVWDSTSRTGVAATDAFAVRPLYYSERAGLIAWSCRAEPLAASEEYEPRYLVELLTSYAAPEGLSVYAGVRMVPPASMATLERNQVTIRTYWAAAKCEVQPPWGENEAEAIAACRRLLIESTRLRMTGEGETWAQLSGGLDSSSVASMAGWLASQGHISGPLAGTVTYVDRQDTQTDEREYSDAVVRHYGLPNVAIVDPPMWYDETYPPITPDQPGLDFHVQPREQRLCGAVRNAGGRILLTGYGGDELFANNLWFLADWMAEGRVLSAVREMAHLAAVGRVSFWDLAYRNALVPLLSGTVQSRLTHADSPPGFWLEPRAVRQHGGDRGVAVLRKGSGPRGGKYHHAIVTGVRTLQGVVHGGILSDALEVRHPLLYRPFVEFALRLPQNLRSRPHAHRWILREAMRGILPELVRTRVGKPATGDVLAWSFAANRSHLERLVEKPILADLGLVDADKVRAAFDASAEYSRAAPALQILLFPTLAVEAWLQIRSGRWPHPGYLSNDRRKRTGRSGCALQPAVPAVE